jgi:hypothetical protein
MGAGWVVGESVLFTYTRQAPFEVNYLTASSYYGNTGEWNFLIGQHP